MDNLKIHSMNKIDDNIKKISDYSLMQFTEVIKGYRGGWFSHNWPRIDFDILRRNFRYISGRI